MKLVLLLASLHFFALFVTADTREIEGKMTEFQELEKEEAEEEEAKEEEIDLRPRERVHPAARRYDGGCGKRWNNRTFPSSLSRIVGGKLARTAEFPWQVLLLIGWNWGKPGYGRCGGVIIDTHTVLTAAHCVAAAHELCYAAPTKDRFLEIFNKTSSYPAGSRQSKYVRCQWRGGDEILVYAGLTKVSGNAGMQKRRVKKIFVPDEFYGRNQNDLAVLMLESPLTFTGTVRSACLPDIESELKPGQRLTVTGWGALKFDDKSGPDRLRKAVVDVFPEDKCHEIYPGTLWKFCAGKKAGGVDSCQGDSGGPIVLKDTSQDHFTVVGLVSFGRGCGQKGYPGAYTDLRYFLDFIRRARSDKIEPVSYTVYTMYGPQSYFKIFGAA